MSVNRKLVLLAGATGYIGSQVVKKLVKDGFSVICPVRSDISENKSTNCKYIKCDIRDPKQVFSLGNSFGKLNYAISCIGSRTGGIEDAWKVEYKANLNLLRLSKSKNVQHFILLSAICVQKPFLEFQRAKLAFENELTNSKVTYSIIRPTAFFKSLSGQIENVKRGKNFILFDDGLNTLCKPISEKDLAHFIIECFDNSEKHNKILPIGGPGPAFTPIEMGRMIFRLTNKKEKFRKLPSGLFTLTRKTLIPFDKLSHKISNLREFLKIAHYYATESMLVWNHEKQNYSAEDTPEFGTKLIWDHFKNEVNCDHKEDILGHHKLF
ncbi:MAG: NAD(P)H-binding protein [Pseudomonadota bacterium]|nr:NAD(P)H-binding protein [Pseudomonadota bacterium]